MKHSLVCLGLLVAAAPAQETHIVGPGGQFSEIDPAIDAAQPGDIILVRARSYDNFTVDKPVRLLGDPGATIAGPGFHALGPAFTVRDIPAGEVAIIRGLDMPTSGGLVASSATVINCAGLVHLENMLMSDSSSFRATDCAQVTVHECALGYATVDNSVVAFTDSSALGILGLAEGAPALDILSGRVVIAGGSYTGGAGFFGSGGPAIRVQGGRLVLTGDAGTAVAAGTGLTPTPTAAIDVLAGELILDPTPTLTPAAGGPPVRTAAGATFIQRVVPALDVAVAGRTMTTSVRAASSSLAVVIASPIAPPLPLPGMDLWLSFSHIVIAQGTIPPTGLRVDSISLPTLSAGTTSPVQAVVLGAGLSLSNPVMTRWD
ncbi:MAG: hypothetical protein AAF628_27590 [Planctomycetota bacterium]